ncbi:MAG TPA: hypothetical protein VIF60_23675 [Burkholderiaceae bacterium]|jgi:hypothetical protein
MGRKSVPVKTKEGTQEIRARTLGLAPRIRTALLLVDGVKSTAELERLMEAAGVTPGALQLLLDKGLIRFAEESDQPTAPVTLHDAAHTVLAANHTEHLSEMAEYPPTLIESPIQQVPSQTVRALHDVAGSKAAPKTDDDRIAPNLSDNHAARPKPPSERVLAAPLEVVTLLELETILGEATKMEVATILGVATMLELTPTQMMAPMTAVKAPLSQPAQLPPLARAQQELERKREQNREQYREQEPDGVPQPKLVLPAAVLRMNLMSARAHLAAALDQFLEVEAYVLRQKVVACETREELEQLYALVEGALIKKIDRSAAMRLLNIATAILDR